MEEKNPDDFGEDGVDDFFGDDVEGEGSTASAMAERCDG